MRYYPTSMLSALLPLIMTAFSAAPSSGQCLQVEYNQIYNNGETATAAEDLLVLARDLRLGIFRSTQNGWIEETTLEHGGCVAISTDLAEQMIITGQPFRGPATVNIYQFDGLVWRSIQQLEQPVGSRFGNAIAVDEDVLVVGSPTYDIPNEADGVAFVYGFDGQEWVEQQVLRELDPHDALWMDFGAAVAIDEGRLVVGAPAFGEHHTGAVYCYTQIGTQWTLQERLDSPDDDCCENFGEQLELVGDTLVVSAPDSSSTDPGNVYVYRWDNSQWQLQESLRGRNTEPGDAFGESIDLKGDLLAIGSPKRFPDGTAHLFKTDGTHWIEQYQFFPSFDTISFGKTVEIFDHAVLFGSPYPERLSVFNFSDLIDCIGMELSTDKLQANSPLEFTAGFGVPGGALVLAIVPPTELSPQIFFPLVFDNFDANGTWTRQQTVPAGLSGTSLTLQLFGFSTPSTVAQSGRHIVTFL